MISETLSFWISLTLTLAIFSYLLGDNALYRLAVSIFVGLVAAFTTTVTMESVIFPLLEVGDSILLFFLPAAVLTILLLLKPIRQLRILTNIALGFLIAIGAAAAVVGAVRGTLIPLIADTTQVNLPSDDPLALLSQVVLVVGVITSLLYFNYSAQRTEQGEIKRGRIMSIIAPIGQGFIVVTLGALYGAAILTSLTILTGQLDVLFGG